MHAYLWADRHHGFWNVPDPHWRRSIASREPQGVATRKIGHRLGVSAPDRCWHGGGITGSLRSKNNGICNCRGTELDRSVVPTGRRLLCGRSGGTGDEHAARKFAYSRLTRISREVQDCAEGNSYQKKRKEIAPNILGFRAIPPSEYPQRCQRFTVLRRPLAIAADIDRVRNEIQSCGAYTSKGCLTTAGR